MNELTPYWSTYPCVADVTTNTELINVKITSTRKDTFTLLITRSSPASNAEGRMAIQSLNLTQQSPFAYFTSRAAETWCLLPFSCSSNRVTLTQYGLLTIHNMIGFWQRCGSVMPIIKFIRFQVFYFGSA